jgi:hypothetical protein
MSKTRNNKTHNSKKNNSQHIKIKVKGGKIDLEQKYSLESIDEGNELGGFKYSNIIIGFLGIGALLYNVYYVNNKIDKNKEVLFI